MFRVRFSSQTDSTNDDAAALLGSPESAGLVLQADYQRAGRGRRGRPWIAPAGSALLFTAILPQAVASEALWCVPCWTSLGVAAGVERATRLHLGLQWPNDLLLGERKCCGILCVSRIAGPRAWVGCGVGLDVRRPSDDAEVAGIETPPAFLSDDAPDVDCDIVFASILEEFEASLPMLAEPLTVAREWEQRAQLAGTLYHLHLDSTGETLTAVARRLDDDGSLIVEHAGRDRRINLADARVLRERPPR